MPTLTRKGGAVLSAVRKGGTVLALHRSGAAPNLDDPVLKEVALEFTSTAENSTKDWTTAFAYIEDIGDGRGYTGGIVGFCSGTSDMLTLIQAYKVATPGNILEKWIPALQTIDAAPYGQRPAKSHELLDPGFTADWAAAAATAGFQAAQQSERDRVYWGPALAQAKVDGLHQLGVAIYYDIMVNHGPGNSFDSFGGIIAGVKAAGTKAPAQGGDEKTFLTAVVNARDAALQSWGSYSANGRSSIHQKFLADNNLTLAYPLTWSVYGDTFTIATPPTPPGPPNTAPRLTGSASLSGTGALSASGAKSGSTTRATTATLATSPTLTTGA